MIQKKLSHSTLFLVSLLIGVQVVQTSAAGKTDINIKSNKGSYNFQLSIDTKKTVSDMEKEMKTKKKPGEKIICLEDSSGTLLQNRNTLSSYSIKKSDTLTYFGAEFSLYIIRPDDKLKTIKVKENKLGETVKEIIRKDNSIADNFDIFFYDGKSSKKLADSSKMQDLYYLSESKKTSGKYYKTVNLYLHDTASQKGSDDKKGERLPRPFVYGEVVHGVLTVFLLLLLVKEYKKVGKKQDREEELEEAAEAEAPAEAPAEEDMIEPTEAI
ncbi:MAG: hypothetical protein AAF335_00275 [Bacteroidota bacterium]